MNFIIAQISNWTPRKYNYRFECLKVMPSHENYYQTLQGSPGYVQLPDENWRRIL